MNAETVNSTTQTREPAPTRDLASRLVEPALPHFDEYEILGILGRGGMGVVYQARDRNLKRLVALKMILAGTHADPDQRARFLLEARAAAQLQHPNIVQVYEVGEHDGCPYFSMEYVPGGSLADLVAAGPVPPDEAARFVEQVARGAGFAHRHGLVHRDLKPANILLSSAEFAARGADSGGPSALHTPHSALVPKVADFGLAKRVGEGEDSGLTRAGAVIGTPNYMAPEQARGDAKQVGPAADVWSLGAVLYHLLTGRPPFQAASPNETTRQVLEADPVPPTQLVPSLPTDLEDVCLTCLRRDPARRYANGDALAADLRRWLSGEPVLARPADTSERARRLSRRNAPETRRRLEDLARLLRDTDPGAVLVTKSVLERVVQAVTGGSWLVWSVPHSHCYPLDRPTLFRLVEQEELHLPPDYGLPEKVLLLVRPTADDLAGPRPALLVKYWRLLFHGAVHRELEARLGTEAAAVAGRVEALGHAALEEARIVLDQDGLLPPKADARTAYIEFAATYLELKYFAPPLVPIYFPSLPPAAEVDALLAQDVDAGQLFKKTRPAGAPDPEPVTDDQSDESDDFYRRLDRAARRAAADGDVVAAAIVYTRAARVAPHHLTAPALAAARQHVYGLVARLQATLGLTKKESDAWRDVLPALLDKADQGSRPVEAGLLYDLQRACRDYEQITYTLDLVEWALSAGKKPIRRPLKGRMFVEVPAHLRAAARKLTAARLTDPVRKALGGLLTDAMARSEERLRQEFRPKLRDALIDAGLQQSTPAEKADLSKTVEELLDRISASGFLTFADVRDAIARGQLKMADLGGPQEYLRGDPLLRLDSRLASQLDGVYRRGTFYVRWLERTTSLLFGTRNGRRVTRYVLLPFGGAFLTGEFFWLLEYERQARAPETVTVQPATNGAPLTPADLSFFGGWNAELWFHIAWVVAGFVALAFVRSARLRALGVETLHVLWRGVRALAWEIPARLWQLPVVRMLLTSWPLHIVYDFVLKPGVLGTVVLLAFPALWDAGWAARIGTFAVAVAIVNSRVGRAIETLLFQVAVQVTNLFRSFPHLLRWVSNIFRRWLEALEWVLARGEDWLRLRGEGSTLAVAVRAVAGLVWAPIAFLIRFYVVVLIEPMVNPLKLPLSILFAKFVYPLLALMGLFTLSPLGSPLVDPLAPFLTWPVAWLVIIGTFYLLPDAVTFLFWEMRENWRLYRANRPTAVRAAAVGPHGETVARLLRPGFHSGTIPRLYARLRAAEQEAAVTGEWRRVRANRQALREVEDSVRRFVERDLLMALNMSPVWAETKLSAGRVELGLTRIRVEVRMAGDDRPAVLEWELLADWLVAAWAAPGWVAGLADDRAQSLANAVAYLHQRAGADLAREQVRAALPSGAEHFDLTAAGLLVWYGPRDVAPTLYDLRQAGPGLKPRTPDNVRPAIGPALETDRVLFRRTRLTWADRVTTSAARGTGQGEPAYGPEGFAKTLLPA
ncbi:MAG TPA: serine/threonine-protein kinase [Gemmataceae bacterium]|nr:serine/threonine-protein kinase [Gemmataceae bacterium]